MKSRNLVGLLLMMAVASGCAIRKNLDSAPFNPTNTAPANDGPIGKDASKGTKYCQPASDGTFTDAALQIDTGTSADGVAWAEGGGCVTRSIRETWAVLNNLELMKFNEIDRFSADRQINPNADFSLLYTVTYYKDTPIGAINFTLAWYHGVSQGTFDDPQEVNIEFQRTKGTSMIPIWHGGIGLIKVTDNVTSISIRNDFLSRALSASANITKAHDALAEMIGKARSGTPDWNRLDAGLSNQPVPAPSSSPTPGPTPIVAPTPSPTPTPMAS